MRRYIYVDDYPEIQEKMKTKPIFMKVHIGMLSFTPFKHLSDHSNPKITAWRS